MTCVASRHGTRAAYLAGCRCPEARQANREYAAWRDRRNLHASYGAAEPLSVAVTETQAVMRCLFDAGWGMRRIEAETSIGRDHLARILGRTSRPLRRVRIGTHKTLAALLDRDVARADGALIDATATWRLIHGLIALGYPKRWIASQLTGGVALQFADDLITVRNARKVRDLADRTITAGPSAAARRYAATRGWTTDMLLDDPEDLDLEEDGLDEAAILRACAGDPVALTKPERREAVRRMHGRGCTYDEMAVRLHTQHRMVHRDLQALGLIDVSRVRE